LEVARRLIHEMPGRTDGEYATIGVKRVLARSNAKDPVQSLATTLSQAVRMGRMRGIKREKVDGKFHYFPADYQPEAKTQPNDSLRIEVSLRPDAARRVRDLVEIGKFRTPGEAVTYLLEEGVNAKQSALDRISSELEEIRRRKESAQGLL